MNYNLNFIDKSKLTLICKDVLDTLKEANNDIEKNLHSNIIDPFSAVFESSFFQMPLKEWIEKEKIRQIQKSFQNAIGTFHQKLLGSLNEWTDLGIGGVVDLVSKERNIIAEVKNKFNTTKGNHKSAIYDDFNALLQNKQYEGFTAYYVAILTKKRFDKPFTPSDNRQKEKREINEKIREIDGASFYEIATGEINAIEKLYKILPYILAEITSYNPTKIINDPLFEELFQKAFK